MKDLPGLFDGVRQIHPKPSIMRNTLRRCHFSQVQQLTLIIFRDSIFCCRVSINGKS